VQPVRPITIPGSIIIMASPVLFERKADDGQAERRAEPNDWSPDTFVWSIQIAGGDPTAREFERNVTPIPAWQATVDIERGTTVEHAHCRIGGGRSRPEPDRRGGIGNRGLRLRRKTSEHGKREQGDSQAAKQAPRSSRRPGAASTSRSGSGRS
jgi:hypothetical protein